MNQEPASRIRAFTLDSSGKTLAICPDGKLHSFERSAQNQPTRPQDERLIVRKPPAAAIGAKEICKSTLSQIDVYRKTIS